ncbi:hypothetical protein JTE90_024121 [Oedothorax gibbosus]|uniref:Fringe-like glycosyltransferase domain-containing protein n=1 Tax=Oedothorax gibbosus TaxID=931172 RepID=A0AAV6TNP0_9ARAC|nr:hypothetical protein JTE90_024121 [Oedothorax gibbosus]
MPKCGFIILQQPLNPYHKTLADDLFEDIRNQYKVIQPEINLILDSDYLEVKGFWTIHPLFKLIAEKKEVDWVVFLEDHTRIDLGKLLQVLQYYDSSRDVFAGYALEDINPTIIHHFASTGRESILQYPHFSAGFFISTTLANKLTQRCGDCIFSIDPKYEVRPYA